MPPALVTGAPICSLLARSCRGPGQLHLVLPVWVIRRLSPFLPPFSRRSHGIAEA